MRYLTKEWYNDCQVSCNSYHFRVHQGTGKYDEKLYKRLYKIKEKKYVDQQIVFLRPGKVDKLDYDYWKMRFQRDHAYNIEHAHKAYRASTLEQIADVRVFVLGYCPKNILQQMKDFDKKIEKRSILSHETCFKVKKQQNLPEYIEEGMNFHDSVVKVIENNDDIVMKFEGKSIYNNMQSVTFCNAKILKDDEIHQGAIYLYDEIYRKDDGYEVHILFYQNIGKDDEKPCDYILECKDISFS